ncbi:ABC transporter permease [Clostridium ljungdahlii]|uniref:ABC-2 family transporter protein n=1 Tax=Clostridium ljungdahlii TaxID=1538 RepID=A0A168NAM2_9CLOT|nr:ABC transporter permease [Clostridium ljungdahlii]OAA86030.1 ABC-2 family transporter protein [Clostridium ljungdahlii]
MLNMIYSELFKLKKTYIPPLVLIGGTIMTILMFVARHITEVNMSFEKYAYNIEETNFIMLFIVLFSIISAYIFSREFADKTADVLYAYGKSRIKIFMSKLIVIYILIFLTYIIEIISMLLSYYFLNGSLPEGHIIIRNLNANSLSILFQFLLVPIPILISNLSRNIIIPAAYGILGFILSSLIATESFSHIAKYIPIMSPWLSAEYFYSKEHVDLNYITISSVLCFIFFISISIYEFNRKDIN